ncbi:MAG: hypothetical protein M1839_005895, partial [Geoglossum umbratile]
GLVVKDALNQSSHSENTRLKEIFLATFGVCFLGTPHRGSKSASIGKIAYQASVAITKRPNIQLLQALERNSGTLDSIADRFGQTLLKGQMQISSFREEMETRRFLICSTIVVDSDSAKIGDRREEVGSIPANHRNMAKFAAATDAGFKRVSSQLRRWVERIKMAKNAFMEHDRHDCLTSLNNEETRQRIQDVSISHRQTFHWLFDREVVKFRGWLESSVDDISRIFWIQGKPGSGKSTLMKYALHEERTKKILATDDSQWTLVGFFFHDRGSGVQKSLSGMLQEILYQILHQIKGLIPFVQPHYAKLARGQQTRSPTWDVDTLRSALLAITKQNEVGACICLFLDALDEHDGDNDQLATLLYDLVSGVEKGKVKIKICLASRSWNIFDLRFGHCPGFAIHNYTQNDIRNYTMSRLGNSLGLARLDVSPEKFESIASQVTGKASGVFIWVKLVVDELVKGIRDGTPLSVLEDELSKIPQELKDLYLRTMSKIEPTYVEECYTLLQIALCSLSPLTPGVIIKCTSYSLRGFPDELASQQEMIRWLKSRSGGLLEIVSRDSPGQGQGTANDSVRVVQFIHQTAKEFVRDYKHDLGLRWGSDDSKPRLSGYVRLLQCAVVYENDWARVFGGDMLFVYANLVEKVSPEEAADVSSILREMASRNNWETLLQMISNSQGYYASRIANRLLEADRSSRVELMCCLAIAAGLRNCVRTMLKGISDFPMDPCLLHIAATGEQIVPNQDRAGMVKTLLDAGHPVDMAAAPLDILPPSHRLHPSFYARAAYTTLAILLRSRGLNSITEESRLSIAKVLLEHGANPNEAIFREGDQMSMNCLQHCARFEGADMARLFLQHGADLSTPHPGSGLTPRMFATLRGNRSVLEAFSGPNIYKMSTIQSPPPPNAATAIPAFSTSAREAFEDFLKDSASRYRISKEKRINIISWIKNDFRESKTQND